MTADALFVFIYVQSIGGCIFLFFVCLFGVARHPNGFDNLYFPNVVGVACAGFAVFPFINTMLCIVLAAYLIATRKDRAAMRRPRTPQ